MAAPDGHPKPMASTPPGPKPIGGYYHTVDPNYESPLEGSNYIFVPSSPATRGFRFRLDFLPGGNNGAWEIADSRGSLILLYRGVQLIPNMLNEQTAAAGSRHNPGFVVCDPLTRQYKAVPCRPEDMEGHQFLGLFLLHGDQTNQQAGGGHISLSNFRVMAALHRPHCCSSSHGVPVAHVFSMGSEVEGAWSSVFCLGSDWHLVKRAWSSEEPINIPNTVKSFYFAGRAYGSLYWGIQGTGTALVLNEATAEFTMVTLPQIMLGSCGRCSFRFISRQDDGALRVVCLVDNNLKVFVRRIIHSNSSRHDEWAVEGLVRLREATRGLPGHEDGYFQDDEAIIVDAQETYVLLTPRNKTWLFSVVLETMEVDRGHERNKYAGPAYPWELPPTIWSPIF
ncbi:uncharacterized protein LOC8075115 [Sorghum bicolor]|uniref:uncharacterized protein LOC8075115 n=1 Tax=Sorghum bicolor TaxID=4558 RepID=UPI0001A84692|nr:uncharacterized protein LOC8075115 [Sorghum bicolor]|eukprot:XP_002455155.1 uncharacterized protein LOC8075115 [Sorghum bicolor]